jgi:hypothetical protein
LNKDKYLTELTNSNIQESEILWEGGSTVSAEIRYICGSNNGFLSEKCIPNIFNGGTAYHGNSLNYFSRYNMYKEFGFKESLGLKELRSINLNECNYTYNAICDDELFNFIVKKIEKNNGCNGFSYFLTIDSHFPYRKYGNHPYDLSINLKNTVNYLSKVNYKYNSCKFIIVGDHPPPLSKGFKTGSVALIKIGF